jgi:hypothetical protein
VGAIWVLGRLAAEGDSFDKLFYFFGGSLFICIFAFPDLLLNWGNVF